MGYRLIGIAGSAGSGKDTAASFLKEGFNYKSVAFADPIRAGMKSIIGLQDKHFQHPTKEVVLPEFGKSPRQMMQTLGTDWARELVHKDFWLILAGKNIERIRMDGYHAVVTDVRFENEAKYIRESGGAIWHMKRDGAGTPHVHASEAGVPFAEGDETIDNSGTLGQLLQQVKLLAAKERKWTE